MTFLGLRPADFLLGVLPQKILQDQTGYNRTSMIALAYLFYYNPISMESIFSSIFLSGDIALTSMRTKLRIAAVCGIGARRNAMHGIGLLTQYLNIAVNTPNRNTF
jgi:hypothetical protein